MRGDSGASNLGDGREDTAAVSGLAQWQADHRGQHGKWQRRVGVRGCVEEGEEWKGGWYRPPDVIDEDRAGCDNILSWRCPALLGFGPGLVMDCASCLG